MKNINPIILSIMLFAGASLSDQINPTIPAGVIYRPIPPNCPDQITMSSITNRPAIPNIPNFEKWANENNAPSELWSTFDDYANVFFANNTNYTPWVYSSFDKLPKITQRMIDATAQNAPDRLEYETIATTNKTRVISKWSIKELVRAVPTTNIEETRKIILEKYIKEIKFSLRRQGKSFVEYINPDTGEKINPLEIYIINLQTALTSPGFGNLSQILSEIGIEVDTIEIPQQTEIEQIIQKILTDELKIDPYKNKLVYWLGTQKFNEFVENYNTENTKN